MDKQRALADLARKRQRATWPGYKNIGDYHNGAYDCPHVSPYTKSACHIDAEIMVMLQDWTSDEYIRGPVDQDAVKYGHTPSLPTNKNLIRLLNEYFRLSLSDVFATNLFPFIKPGNMRNKIPQRDLLHAAKEFAIPQIQIIQPKLVICLGLQTYNALREACGHARFKTLPDAINSPFTFERSRIWCQAHTGGCGQAMRNAREKRVPTDWTRMKHDLGM